MNHANAHKSLVQLITKAAIIALVIVLFTNQVPSQRRKKRQSRPVTESWHLFTSPDKDFTLRFPQNQNENPKNKGRFL